MKDFVELVVGGLYTSKVEPTFLILEVRGQTVRDNMQMVVLAVSGNVETLTFQQYGPFHNSCTRLA
jgi:hypothetical protein